jgi:hypothetical protein
VACVKDEGANLVTLEKALQLTVSCDVLGLPKPFSSACFGHIMSKVCNFRNPRVCCVPRFGEFVFLSICYDAWLWRILCGRQSWLLFWSFMNLACMFDVMFP